MTTQVDTLAFRSNAEALIRVTQDHFCDGRCCYVCGPTVHWPCPPARANRVATEAIALLDELAAARATLAQHEGTWATFDRPLAEPDTEEEVPLGEPLPPEATRQVRFRFTRAPDSGDDAAATEAARTAKGWAHD